MADEQAKERARLARLAQHEERGRAPLTRPSTSPSMATRGEREASANRPIGEKPLPWWFRKVGE